MSFGNRLRELRLSRELTQADFANAINLGESTISFYESDKRSPDYETLVKIARFFNVSTDYLLCQTDDPTPHIRVKIATKIDPDNPDIEKNLWEIREGINHYVAQGIITEQSAADLLKKARKQLELDVELLKSQNKQPD
jgi:transcriptional regulator with XRE-family HTH domain